MGASEPTVGSLSCTASYDEIACTANITDDGTKSITEKGFVYLEASSGDPTVATNDGSVYVTGSSLGEGSYSNDLTGLSLNTDYRVRGYAENSEGIGYTATQTVRTESIVGDIEYGDYSDTGAVFESSAEAGITITKRGFVWLKASSGDPTYASNDGYVEDTGTLSTGAFSKTVTSMDAASDYRVRAFTYSATYGYQYSDTLDFTTLAAGRTIQVRPFGAVVSSTGWTNPTNALVDNTYYAYCSISGESIGPDIILGSAGFSVPSGSTIIRITGRIRGRNATHLTDDSSVRYPVFYAPDNSAYTIWTKYTFPDDILTTVSFSTTSWNETATDINSDDFELKFSIENLSVAGRQVYIEYVEVEVEYEPPSSSKIHVKDDSVIKQTELGSHYVKDSGVWKEATVWVKNSGVWESDN
jgi:hypothetical protein